MSSQAKTNFDDQIKELQLERNDLQAQVGEVLVKRANLKAENDISQEPHKSQLKGLEKDLSIFNQSIHTLTATITSLMPLVTPDDSKGSSPHKSTYPVLRKTNFSYLMTLISSNSSKRLRPDCCPTRRQKRIGSVFSDSPPKTAVYAG